MNGPLDELIETLRVASRNHYQATLEGDYKVTSKSADIEEAAFKKIIAFGVEGREALLKLVDDPDKSVALSAAAYSINYSPERCEEVIRRIAKDREMIGFMAQPALKRWAEGNLNFG